MKITLAYIAVAGGTKTEAFAARFVASYQLFPPGVEHETIIVCNGGPLSNETGLLFMTLPHHIFYPRLNEGWDIAAYLEIARKFECDMLVCLGESVHFHRAGWLARMVDVWRRLGSGMYGFWSSNLVRPHLNTTGFVVDPVLLRLYRNKVVTKTDRYQFEHGRYAFWKRVRLMGKPVRLVTWDGDWPPERWRQPANILWRGDQSNCLAYCSHTDNYLAAPLETRRVWQRHIDSPYRE